MKSEQQQFDGLTVFIPIVSELLPGDILLTFNARGASRKEAKGSKLIRSATGGQFSHALICSTPPTFVEAIGPGVSTLSLALCFAYDLQHVRLLRYPDPEVARRAATSAQLEIGRDYSIGRAVGSIMPEPVLRRIDDLGVFCSALVAQAFVSAGAEPFAKTPVERTTPATIEHISELLDVTTEIFRPALAPRNIERMSALDGDRVQTPSGAQTEISNRYAKAVLGDAERLATRYPAASLKVLPTLYGMLQLVMDAFDAAGDGRVPESEVEQLDRRLAALILQGELDAVVDEAQERDRMTLERDLQQSFEAIPDIDRDAMRAFLDTSRMQLEVRERALRSLDVWGSRSEAMNAYLRIDRRTVELIRNRIPLLEEILARLG